jgi:tagatose 6-phosphate kinase
MPVTAVSPMSIHHSVFGISFVTLASSFVILQAMILSAGLSPAWQQILTFDAVRVGHVNRATSAWWCASGKVLNVARAVQSLDGDGHTLCTIGGLSGEAIRSEFAVDGIAATWIQTQTSTRVCTTLIDHSHSPPQVTELVENALPITVEELAAFEHAWHERSADADLAVLTGSLPAVANLGRPSGLWSRMLAGGPPAILDVRGPELLAALPHRPLLVKPNREELAATVGRSLNEQSDVIAAMRELNDAGAQWVLVTDGPRPALLSSSDQLWRLIPPTCDVVNPIGCGDCLAAGIAVSLEAGENIVDAVRFGMAASVVNLGQLLPARLSLEHLEQTVQDVTVDQVT